MRDRGREQEITLLKAAVSEMDLELNSDLERLGGVDKHYNTCVLQALDLRVNLQGKPHKRVLIWRRKGENSVLRRK